MKKMEPVSFKDKPKMDWTPIYGPEQMYIPNRYDSTTGQHPYFPIPDAAFNNLRGSLKRGDRKTATADAIAMLQPMIESGGAPYTGGESYTPVGIPDSFYDQYELNPLSQRAQVASLLTQAGGGTPVGARSWSSRSDINDMQLIEAILQGLQGNRP